MYFLKLKEIEECRNEKARFVCFREIYRTIFKKQSVTYFPITLFLGWFLFLFLTYTAPGFTAIERNDGDDDDCIDTVVVESLFLSFLLLKLLPYRLFNSILNNIAANFDKEYDISICSGDAVAVAICFQYPTEYKLAFEQKWCITDPKLIIRPLDDDDDDDVVLVLLLP